MHNNNKNHAFNTAHTSTHTTITSLPAQNKNNEGGEGGGPNSIIAEYEKRGNYLFAIVMLGVIWSFTIPPEIRREHICFSRECRVDNTGKFCYDCVSFGEFSNQIKEYYKGGGGIQFDFSIEGKD